MEKEIVEVLRQKVTGGWKYVGVYADGSVETIRAKATREYVAARQFSKAVNSGNKRGLALYFTFSTSAKFGGATWAPVVRDFVIKELV